MKKYIFIMISILAVSFVLIASISSPLVTEDVVICPAGSDGYFELISTKRRNLSINPHVANYSVASPYRIYFHREEIIEVQYLFPRSSENVEFENKLNYCRYFGVAGDSTYVINPFFGGGVFVLKNGQRKFIDIFPRALLDAQVMSSEGVLTFIWTSKTVNFLSEYHVVIDQAGEYPDTNGCSFVSVLSLSPCQPARIRRSETLDGGETWSEPTIIYP